MKSKWMLSLILASAIAGCGGEEKKPAAGPGPLNEEQFDKSVALASDSSDLNTAISGGDSKKRSNERIDQLKVLLQSCEKEETSVDKGNTHESTTTWVGENCPVEFFEKTVFVSYENPDGSVSIDKYDSWEEYSTESADVLALVDITSFKTHFYLGAPRSGTLFAKNFSLESLSHGAISGRDALNGKLLGPDELLVVIARDLNFPDFKVQARAHLVFTNLEEDMDKWNLKSQNFFINGKTVSQEEFMMLYPDASGPGDGTVKSFKFSKSQMIRALQ